MLVSLTPIFVEYIPRELDPGKLYVSMAYATASHLCACGCGERVVTPLSPSGWTLHFDGQVTLSPSIGNWQQPCRSHYFIRGNRIVGAAQWSQTRIDAAVKMEHGQGIDDQPIQDPVPAARRGLWRRIRAWLG